MTSQDPISPACPVCKSFFFRENEGEWHCQACGFNGLVRECHPRRDDNTPAEIARIEDAVCANHPGKKAVAICSGTGDYICSLCRVVIHGKDYSVQYLDRGGKVLAGQTFSQYLPRPDRLVKFMLIGSLMFAIMTPFLFIYSCVCLRRAQRLRTEDGIYAKVIESTGMWICWSVHLLLFLAFLGLFTLAIIGIVDSMPSR